MGNRGPKGASGGWTAAILAGDLGAEHGGMESVTPRTGTRNNVPRRLPALARSGRWGMLFVETIGRIRREHLGKRKSIKASTNETAFGYA